MLYRMKKALAMLLAALLCASLFPSAFGEEATQGTCGQTVSWSFASGTLSVSGSGAIYDYSGLNPAPWDHLKTKIDRIEIGSGITRIGAYAFAGIKGPEILYIPEGVAQIGNYAFSGCTGVWQLVLPSSLNTIGDYAFYQLTGIKDVSYAGTGTSKGLMSIGTNNTALEQFPEWSFVPSLAELVYISVPAFEHGTLELRKCYAQKGEKVYFTLTMDTGWDVFSITADNGTVNAEEGWVALNQTGSYSTLTINVIASKLSYEAYLRKWARDPQAGTLTIDEDITLTNSFVLPADKSLRLRARLTVAPGKTFVQNDIIIIEDGGELVVPETAEYECNAGITLYGGLSSQGRITLSDNAYIDARSGKLGCKTESDFVFPEGKMPVTVKNPSVELSNIPAAAVLLQKETETDAETLACIAFASSGACGRARVNAFYGFTVYQDCVIPENFALYSSGKLLIKSGVLLENKGEILLDGSFTADRAPFGSLTIESGALLNNRGTIKVCRDKLSDNDRLNNTGTLRIISLTPTVSTEEKLRLAIEYPATVTLSDNLDVFADLVIPKDVTLTIPAGYSLHLGEGAKLKIEGTLNNNGSLIAFGGVEGAVTGNAAKQKPLDITDMGFCPKGAEDKVAWELNSEGCLTLSGSGEMKDLNSGLEPWKNSATGIKTIIINGLGSVSQGLLSSAPNCTELRFIGDAPTLSVEPGEGLTLYYPCWGKGWSEAGRAALVPGASWELWHPHAQYIETVETPQGETEEAKKFKCPDCLEEFALPIPYEGPSVCIPDFQSSGLTVGQTVYADGRPRTVREKGIILLPLNGADVITAYEMNDSSSQDDHTRYPVGMKVWRVSEDEGGFTAERIEEMDDLLQYAGTSIRMTGVKGIRMITGIDSAKRELMTGEGLGGYTLEEYGTLLCFRSEMTDGSLVLSDSYARSNYAYKKGVADPVFARTSSQLQYTNVLVGFSDEQCSDDIAMRSYMKLRDSSGETITVYGGMLYRSIGYVAYQNRNAFPKGSAAGDYIRHIIHTVYGDKYDE